MSLFSLGGKKDRYGIIIDVGSGSVLTAIVHSKKGEPHPMIIWAHREHTALKNIESIQQSAKAVMSTLMGAGIKLDSEGRKILMDYAPGAKLSVAQCSIAAPWSYTVTKTISLNQEDPIEITENFIDELIFTAQKQVEEDLSKHADVINTGLTVISKATMDLLSNGYRIKHPAGELASSINLTHATVVAQQYVMNGIEEVQQKLFPATKVEAMSFILMLYFSMRAIEPQTDDICLIDITDEASDIGIMRDGSLKYSTYMPYGMFTIAREISLAAKIPLHEALGHLRSKDVGTLKSKVSESSHNKITEIFDSYIKQLASLLNETGDSLSIPKRVYLHIESSYEPLFSFLTARAARFATKIDHQVSSISAEIIPQEHREKLFEMIGEYSNDTALLLNAEFFHKQKHYLDFNYT